MKEHEAAMGPGEFTLSAQAHVGCAVQAAGAALLSSSSTWEKLQAQIPQQQGSSE